MTAKTVLITGASGGIGYELARSFARQQQNLILVARNKEKLEQIREELIAQRVEVMIIQKDLTVPSAALEVYRELKAHGKQVDILINNAGFGLYGVFHELELRKQVDMVQLNITALTQLTHLVVQEMAERRSGQILNIASRASFHAIPLMAVYAATKAYVLSFSEALASELDDYGISVTAVCPGPVQTGFSKVANLEDSKMFSTHAMSAEKVAAIAISAVKKGRRVQVPGVLNYLSAVLVRFMPRKMLANISKAFILKKQ